LPKAIGKSQDFKLSTALTWEDFSSAPFTLSPAAFEVEAGIIRLLCPRFDDSLFHYLLPQLNQTELKVTAA
jgi:hypothetical protein